MSSSTEKIPPDVFGDGELITFFPTVEFLESQANFLWNSSETYSIRLSSHKDIKRTGTNPYLLNVTITDLTRRTLSEKFDFKAEDIDLVYDQSNTCYVANLPEKTIIKVKKPANVDSVYINKGTLTILGSDINYSSNNQILLTPFKDNIKQIHSNFFNTSANCYYLGLANDIVVELLTSPDFINKNNINYVVNNSTNDFISKSILNFEDKNSMATFVELTPLNFDYGTNANRPTVYVDYGTSPVSFTSSLTDLVYDCMFIFKSSIEDGEENKNLMVCYVAPLNQDYYLFGLESSKAMYDDSKVALEITENFIKTELTWEVIIF